MRDLQVNLRPIYYAMYVGFMEGTVNGFPSGQPVPQYTNPRPAMVCISTPTGENESTPFGSFTDYDKVMTTANDDFKADEHSVLWVDDMPLIKADGSTDTPPDYEIKKYALWGGQKTYAIKKKAANMDDMEYLKKLLSNGSISQAEYDKYSAMMEGQNED